MTEPPPAGREGEQSDVQFLPVLASSSSSLCRVTIFSLSSFSSPSFSPRETYHPVSQNQLRYKYLVHESTLRTLVEGGGGGERGTEMKGEGARVKELMRCIEGKEARRTLQLRIQVGATLPEFPLNLHKI